MSSTASSTKTPTVTVTVAKFDLYAQERVFRVAESQRLAAFRELGLADYTPRGSTPLRTATLEMIEYLDAMRSPDSIQIGLLLDESGSMSGNRESVVEGVNEFVTGLRDIDASEGNRVLCMIFTDGKENASHHTERNVTPDELRAAIHEREANGWTFIYMGANQDAWNEGSANLGISGGVRGQSVNFASTPVGTHSAFKEASRRAGAYASSPDDYDMLAASVGNNSTIAEDGTVTSDSSQPSASPSMPKPGAPKKPKASPKKEPKKSPPKKTKPYGDVSKAMDTVTEAFKKVRGD